MKKYLNTKSLFLTIVFFIFMTILILMEMSVVGFSIDDIEGRGLFDAELSYYNGNYFYETVSLMTTENMEQYHIFHYVDYIFVLSYFLMMSIIIIPVLPQKLKKLGYIIPAFPAITDLIENISIDILLHLYPIQSAYANIVGLLTCVKWYSGLAWFIIFIVFFIINFYRLKIIEKRKV